MQRQAFNAWADWAKIPLAEREPLRARCDSAELNALGQLLFYPPDSELRYSQKDWSQTPADEIYARISKRLGINPKDFWPEAQPYALCVTHDIDRIFSSYHGLRSFDLLRVLRDWASLQSPKRNSFFNFERIRSFEKELGLRSAWYVLFEKRRWSQVLTGEIQHAIGVYKPNQIAHELQTLQAEGHEIALHASFDAWSNIQRLTNEVGLLASLGIKDVSGVRNHYLPFDNKINQAEAGFNYDSSLGFNYLAGFRCGTSFPFSLLSGITELPLSLMDTSLRAQSKNKSERKKIAFSILDRVRKNGGLLMLNWHAHLCNPDLAESQMDLLKEIISEAKRDGAWLALPRDLAKWWKRE